MNWTNFITSETGLVHFIASMLALVLGTLVLFNNKGTPKHKLLGKLYAVVMFVVLITAFMTYRLFGKWGIFHWSALVSSITLTCGLIPMIAKHRIKNHISLHFSFMYWSVMGVYGAFIAETLVRMPKVAVESGIPTSVFYNMTGIATGVVMGIGAYCFLKQKPKWDQKFAEHQKESNSH